MQLLLKYWWMISVPYGVWSMWWTWRASKKMKKLDGEVAELFLPEDRRVTLKMKCAARWQG